MRNKEEIDSESVEERRLKLLQAWNLPAEWNRWRRKDCCRQQEPQILNLFLLFIFSPHDATATHGSELCSDNTVSWADDYLTVSPSPFLLLISFLSLLPSSSSSPPHHQRRKKSEWKTTWCEIEIRDQEEGERRPLEMRWWWKKAEGEK